MRRLEIIDHFGKLDGFEKQWNQLVQTADTRTIFQTYEWNRCWWETFKQDKELFILILTENGSPVGIAPLFIFRGSHWIRGRQSTIGFLGIGHSDYCDFIVSKDKPEILVELLEALLVRFNRWDQIQFTNIPEGSRSFEVIKKFSNLKGLNTVFRYDSYCYSLVIRGNEEECSKLADKKRLRQYTRYFLKQGQFEVLHTKSEPEIRSYLDAFFKQHIERWNGSKYPSLFHDNRNKLFYQKLVKFMCNKQWLLFTLVKSKGVPIAFHFGFDYQETLLFYKPTFNREFSKHSPGMVLLKELINYAITSKNFEVDLSLGDETYKKHFSNTVRRNSSARIYKSLLQYQLGRIFLYLRISIGKMVREMSLWPVKETRRIDRNKSGSINTIENNPSKGKKVNILFLIDMFLDRGGTEAHIADLVENLDKNKFNCTICAFDSNESEFITRIREKGITVRYIPLGKIYGWKALGQAWELYKFIRTNQFDIVQTFHFKSDTYGVVVSKFAGVPNIISSRRDLGDLKRTRQILVNRLANPLIDHFLMVCKAVGDAAWRDERIPSSKVTLSYNGVDLKRFNLSADQKSKNVRRDLGLNEHEVVIGSVAYFREEKAYDVFFKALDHVRDKATGWKVLILGDGPLEGEFKAYCKENDLEDYVTFMGAVDDVERYIGVMDLICLVPKKNEGFSNAILEGMANGKPVIATNVGGNSESVVDGETGIIIPPNRPDHLAEAILKLLADKDLRANMGRKGRERIEKYFSMDVMIQRLEQFYSERFKESLK